MPKSDFENLKVYQLAEQLADEIWDAVTEWDQFARNTVGGQIVRAADSIGANIVRDRDVVVFRTTGDSSAWLEVH